jgi:hypothetical protein
MWRPGGGSMSIEFTDLLGFLAELEHDLQKIDAVHSLDRIPRPNSETASGSSGKKYGLLPLLEELTKCRFDLRGLDFSNGLPEYVAQFVTPTPVNQTIVETEDLASLIFNMGSHAEIWINEEKDSEQKPILNRCYVRFLSLKEAFHVVLRNEFLRRPKGHPDAVKPEVMTTLIEKILFLPFSIMDFDHPDHSDELKIENAAEFFAAAFLYPLDHVNVDRKEFLSKINANDMSNPRAISASTFSYADRYKIPRRYVDLLFRWADFDEIYALYRQKRSKIPK